MSAAPFRATYHIQRLARATLKRLQYQTHLIRNRPAGDFRYVSADWSPTDTPLVELRVRCDGDFGVTESAAREWCEHQTLPELIAIGFDGQGQERWRVSGPDVSAGSTPSWFVAPQALPRVWASHLESCLLVAAAEAVDAVVLDDTFGNESGEGQISADIAHSSACRGTTLYRSDAYTWDPVTDIVRPAHDDRLVKFIGNRGSISHPNKSELYGRFRRGPYISSSRLGPTLKVGLRKASILRRRARQSSRPPVLVLVPFLAQGGAEQTLYEVMAELKYRFDFSIATLAPHAPEIGDRRPDFRNITERIYCLGDHVHPDAMVGILESLIESLGTSVLYNANGTTLFYDFAPRLKEAIPGLRIIDHLFDHRIGYINSYDESTSESVDACVAENHRVAEALTNDLGWPKNRVPVIWPCGRSPTALPGAGSRDSIRHEMRKMLGVGCHDVLFLSAARTHAQKRPLDLVELAVRTSDLGHIHYVLVGGGELERIVDATIEERNLLRMRRLPFRDDIPDLILAADAGILVSEFEGLPVFMLECFQLGTPFIGTDVGDIRRVLDETGAGIVAGKPGDLLALEKAVRHIADPSNREKYTARAQDAGPRFGVEPCARAYARVFNGEF